MTKADRSAIIQSMTRPPWLVIGCLLAAACGGGGGIAVPRPVGLAPQSADSAAAFAASTVPAEPRDIRIRWQFRDDQGAAGGRGRVRFATPDSARLDVQGPLGSGRAAAFVRGDTAVWAEPEQDIRRLVPNYPLFWALLGVVRPPVGMTEVRHFQDATLSAWQYNAGADTVEYVRVNAVRPRLVAEVRQAGRKIGTVETTFGPDGMPASARLIVPGVPARLDITFTSNQRATPFAADTWAPDQP